MKPIEELFRELADFITDAPDLRYVRGSTRIAKARAALREIAERWPNLSSTPTDIEIIRDLNNQRRAILAALEGKDEQ